MVTPEPDKHILLAAAQAVLGYFGFDRIIYGDRKNTIPRKWRWLQELRQQRDILCSEQYRVKY